MGAGPIMNCPSCGGSVPDGAVECPSCGVIFAKFRRRTTETRLPVPHPPLSPPPQPEASTGLARPLIIGLVGAALLIGGFWFVRIRPRTASGGNGSIFSRKRAAKPTVLKATTSRFTGFDIAYALPGSPEGVATNGKEIVIGNRRDPWGLIRMRVERGEWVAEQVPVLSTHYDQKMSFNAFTWNGENYIGYTTASWFEAQGDAFTIHDPKTLRLIGWKAAPKQLGCLAWDGTSYWAATRRNTRDAPEPALLYHLDKSFNVISTSDSPAYGCQGLAWDGRHLWWADVFSDEIIIIDPRAVTPEVVLRAPTDFSYLSGVVVFSGDIWVTDYDVNMIHRLKPDMRVAWLGGQPSPQPAAIAASMVPVSSEDKTAILTAHRENSFVDRKPDDTELVDWSAELRDDAIYGTWRIWFGPDLFVPAQQTSTIVTLPVFARYTLTVRGPDGKEVEREFDATAGDNVMAGVRLADATLPGEYEVDVFLHVQYIKPDGGGQILNRSNVALTLRK